MCGMSVEYKKIYIINFLSGIPAGRCENNEAESEVMQLILCSIHKVELHIETSGSPAGPTAKCPETAFATALGKSF